MPGKTLLQMAALIAGSLLAASSASAYYYYTQFSGRSAPFSPIVEKFDLNSLNNNTVGVFISDQGPGPLAPGDSYAAVVSEIRSAAKVWNDVATSNIRLRYDGLFTVGATQSTPAVNVQFSSDIPPGLLAMSGPAILGNVQQGANGAFIPILQSNMVLEQDLSQMPSFSELFFTTVVHEFGHTLGLQHTLTSSVMSTAQTSASTRANPLAADDIAGISLLYPAQGYLAGTGSITGSVNLSNGTGVNLASVVAISPNRSGISALTNPDGSFRIDGIPPGQYYVYAHPLPPPQMGESSPANIIPPVDANGNPFPAGPNFAAQFYPDTQDWTQALTVFVYAETVSNGINFSVAARNAPDVFSVRSYGYSTGVAEPSAPLMPGVPANVLASGTTGLLQNASTSAASLTQGLHVGLLGTAAQIYNVQPYAQQFVLMDFVVSNVAGPGPKHLLFSTPGDLYVLPSGINVVQNPPPSITSATGVYDQNGNRAVALDFSNFQPDTKVFFDGAPADIEGTGSDGRLLVLPPPAPGNYTASVVALTPSDGQSSLFVQGNQPATYTYDPSPSPVLNVSPPYLTPGADTLVDITAQNTNFISGKVTVGFGVSDAMVKDVNVLSPTHMQVTVSNLGANFLPTSALNITHGLRVLSQNLGVSVSSPTRQ